MGEGVREREESVVGVATRSEVSRYYSKPPDWALTLCVTCQSSSHHLVHTS